MGTKQALTISFACRGSKVSRRTGEAPIECFITVDGKRTRITLPKKARPEQFRPLLNAAEPNDVSIFCAAVKSKINEIQTELYFKGDAMTSARIADIFQSGSINKSYTLKDMHDEFKKQKMSEGIEPLTWGKYEFVYKSFLELTHHKETDEAKEITNADIQEYEAAIHKDCETTRCKKLKNLKAFFAYAVAGGNLKNNPFGAKKIGHGTAEKKWDFLTYDELQELKQVKLTSEKLINTLIIFLWQCGTGQNFSDISILKEGDVKMDETGQYYINKARYKTGRYGKEHYYKAVLIEDAITIYENYGIKIPIPEHVQTYNENLKELIGLTEIKKKITSKSGRKTYACLLVNHLMIDDYNVLKEMLGHENISQTQEYVELLKETVLKSVREKKKEKLLKEIQAKHPNDEKAQEIDRILNEVD